MATRRFFEDDSSDQDGVPDGQPATALPVSEPRSMTAGVEQLDINKVSDRSRRSQAWQTAAWAYADQIGAIKYAFGLTANISSRARLYAGIIDNNDEAPTDVESFLASVESIDSEQHATHMLDAAKHADAAVRELFRGGQARLTRLLALNLQVAGEAYIFDNHGIWDVASISEIKWGDPPRVHRTRHVERTGQVVGTPLKQDAYIARVYREHPQFAGDPDSNMIGVLDDCEQVALFNQMMRTITRSRLSAPVWVIPEGTVSLNGQPIDEAIRDLVQQPIEDEASFYTVAPLILQAPEGKKIEKIELGRTVDDGMVSLQENYMQRILDGLDLPKDMVSGMEGVRYSNALSVSDNYYKGHVEPLLVLISDILTYAYLRPMLHKAGVAPEIIDRFVIWYNPSAIVTRPDRSASADSGYGQKLISGKAWRRAHGYSEHDAPDDDEILRRMAMERAVIPPDMSPVLLESLNPKFFADARQAGQESAGIPSDVAQLLQGGEAAPPAAEPPPTDAAPVDAPAPENDPAAPPGVELRPENEERAQEINDELQKVLNAPSDGSGEIRETEGQTEATRGGKVRPGGTMPPRPR